MMNEPPGRTIVTRTALACALAFLPGAARADDEPRFDALARALRTPAARVLVLVQGVADFQNERSFPGHNGFSVATARVGLSGELDRGFSYLVRADLVREPALLDGRLSYAHHPALAFDVGRFKVPFSREFLTGAGAIDFVNRAQAISALVPGRQAGVQARGQIAARRIQLAAGAWNGNGSAAGNDDEGFLYAARLSLHPRADAAGLGPLELGASLASARDHGVTLVGGALGDFAGDRRLAGADVRWSAGPWIAAAEILGARLEPEGGGRIEPWGGHVTVGRRVAPRVQLLARAERFQRAGLGADDDLVVLGANLTASRPVSVQINHVMPTRTGPRRHQLLVNVQLDF